MWVWHHSFCPSYHPQNGYFTTIKRQIKHNSADSCICVCGRLIKRVPHENYAAYLDSPTLHGHTLVPYGRKLIFREIISDLRSGCKGKWCVQETSQFIGFARRKHFFVTPQEELFLEHVRVEMI